MKKFLFKVTVLFFYSLVASADCPKFNGDYYCSIVNSNQMAWVQLHSIENKASDQFSYKITDPFVFDTIQFPEIHLLDSNYSGESDIPFSSPLKSYCTLQNTLILQERKNGDRIVEYAPQEHGMMFISYFHRVYSVETGQPDDLRLISKSQCSSDVFNQNLSTELPSLPEIEKEFATEQIRFENKLFALWVTTHQNLPQELKSMGVQNSEQRETPLILPESIQPESKAGLPPLQRMTPSFTSAPLQITESKNVGSFKKKKTSRKKCDHCAYSPQSGESLKKHLESHGLSYNCQYCGDKFSNISNKLRHVKTAHQGLKYPCNICGKSYSRRGILRKHQQTFHEEE